MSSNRSPYPGNVDPHHTSGSERVVGQRHGKTTQPHHAQSPAQFTSQMRPRGPPGGNLALPDRDRRDDLRWRGCLVGLVLKIASWEPFWKSTNTTTSQSLPLGPRHRRCFIQWRAMCSLGPPCQTCASPPTLHSSCKCPAQQQQQHTFFRGAPHFVVSARLQTTR